MGRIKNKTRKYKGLVECSNDYFFLEAGTELDNTAIKTPVTSSTGASTTPTTPVTNPTGDLTADNSTQDVAQQQTTTNNNLAPANQSVVDTSKVGASTPGTRTTSGPAPVGDQFGSGELKTDVGTTGNTDTGTASVRGNIDTADSGTTTLDKQATAKPSTTPTANPTGAAGGLNSASGLSKVGAAMASGGGGINQYDTSAGGESLSQATNKPQPQIASTILLSKLLPTESELKTMPKAYLKMFKEMIHNCGLTEDMLPPPDSKIMDKNLPGYTIDRSIMSNYRQLAIDVLKDPLKAINATRIVPKFVFLEGVSKAINTIVSLAKAAKDFKKIVNKPLNSVFDTLPEVVDTGVKSMQNMLDENMDWIGTVMSKPLNQWNIAFADTTVKNWKCSELFVLCAICCSIVFTCSKIMSALDNKDLAKNTVENNIKKIKTIKNVLKESKAVFGGIRNLIEAGLDVNTKLDKYADGKIPTNVILINSMILKAGKPAKDLLTRIVSDKGEDTTVDKSISINKPFYTLCTFASSFVLLWIKIAGMYIKNANDINIVSNMMSDKIRTKIDPSEKNVLKSLFGGVKEKVK